VRPVVIAQRCLGLPLTDVSSPRASVSPIYRRTAAAAMRRAEMLVAFIVIALLTVWCSVVVTVVQVLQVERSRLIGQRAGGARLVCSVCGAHTAIIVGGSIEAPRKRRSVRDGLTD
jgi:hypothetical protein